MTDRLSEASLVERMKSSDTNERNAAFREFVRLYSPRVYGLAYQLCGNKDNADDITQEVFVRAVEALHRFQGTASLSTWLHRITLNLHIDTMRSAHARYSAAWDDVRDNNAKEAYGMNPQPLPDASTDGALQQERFEQALSTLPTQQRAVVILRFVQEFSLEEIAHELGVTVGTVKTLVFRAVRTLRDALHSYRAEFSPTEFHPNNTDATTEH